MSKFSNRLRGLRHSKELSQQKLADLIGVSKSSINMYERGDREPGLDTLESIADFFNVDMDYLMGISSEPNRALSAAARLTLSDASPTVTEDTVTFPVIGELAAGYDHFMNEDYDTFDSIEVPTSYLKGRPKSDFLVLKIHGNSMYPIYMENDKVLIKKAPTLEHSGDIGVIQYEDYATLKKVEFVHGEDWLRLVPINPLYQPKTISGAALEQCRVIGVPVLLVREVEQQNRYNKLNNINN